MVALKAELLRNDPDSAKVLGMEAEAWMVEEQERWNRRPEGARTEGGGEPRRRSQERHY
jgi:hypothetical protein